MDAELIKRWNAKVDKGDLVYVLGDMIWKSRNDDAPSLIKSLNGQIAQFEETIDKFKPSRSPLCETVTAHLEEKDQPYCTCWKAAAMIKFIMTEPNLAFCRDYLGWDYNREFHSREEAEKEYLQFCEHRDQENQDIKNEN